MSHKFFLGKLFLHLWDYSENVLRVSDSKNGAHLTWWVTILYSNLYQLMQNDQKLGKMILNLTELRPKSFGTKLNLTELGQHFLEPN